MFGMGNQQQAALLAQLGIRREQVAADLAAVASGEKVTLTRIEEAAATRNLTPEMLQEIAVSKALTLAKKEDAIATLSQILQNKGMKEDTAERTAAKIVNTAAIHQNTSAVNINKKSWLAWYASNPVGWIMAGVAAIALIVKGFDHYNKRIERAAEATDKAFEAFNSTESEIDSLADKLQETSTRLDELYKLRDTSEWNDTLQTELTSLETQNETLRTQIKLLQDKAKLEQGEALVTLNAEVAKTRGEKNYNSLYNFTEVPGMYVGQGMGYVEGGPLYDRITEQQYYNEAIQKLEELRAVKQANAQLNEQEITQYDAIAKDMNAMGVRYTEWAQRYREAGDIASAREYELMAAAIAEATVQSDYYAQSTSTNSKIIQDAIRNQRGGIGEYVNDLKKMSAEDFMGDSTSAAYKAVSAFAEQYGMTVAGVAAELERLGYFQDKSTGSTDDLVHSFESLKSIVDEAGDSLDSLSKSLETALDWRSTNEQIQSALDNIYKLTGIKLNIDDENLSATLNMISSYIDGGIEEFDEYLTAALDALGVKPDTKGIVAAIEALIEKMAVLTGAALEAGNAMLIALNGAGLVDIDPRMMAARANGYAGSIASGASINMDAIKSYSDSLKAARAKSSKSSLPADYEKQLKELQHLRDMDVISEAQYYQRLRALADQYLKGRKQYLDEYRSIEVEIYQWRKKQAEEANKAQLELDKKYHKNKYEADKKALEDERDRLNKEKDAYKDLIDYRKKLLDDASDERSHNQRVGELNKEIADIRDEMASLGQDDTAKANARKIELRDELNEKLLDLENEQYDRSKDIQKDALDEEYNRFEKLIDGQIDLVDKQLDALSVSYDATIESLEAASEAYISSLNEQFNNLVNAAQSAASQIAAIFAQTYDLTSKSGVSDLQSSLVGAGYDIGNYGPNKDGVDGVLGNKTEKALVMAWQEYLNSLGANLTVDGIRGSKTKAAEQAFGVRYQYHSGGIVGKPNEDPLKYIIPVSREEQLAKLQVGEGVFTQAQMNEAGELFKSQAHQIASYRNAMNDLQKQAIALASHTVTNNNSPSVIVHNSFAGPVDSSTLRQLENWGDKFKKEIVNQTFATMGKHNVFSGRTRLGSV